VIQPHRFAQLAHLKVRDKATGSKCNARYSLYGNLNSQMVTSDLGANSSLFRLVSAGTMLLISPIVVLSARAHEGRAALTASAVSAVEILLKRNLAARNPAIYCTQVAGDTLMVSLR
jgi:hypothetical protein